MFRQRVLFTFSVTGDIRFISHHDMMRVLERAVRRSGLPVATSQGFNPRPKIAILQARGVGISSEVEYVEIDFDGWIGPGEIRRRLDEVLPDGLELKRVVMSNPRAHAMVSDFTYRVEFSGPIPFAQEALQQLLDGREILVERKRKGKLKTVNVRPAVDEVRMTDGSSVLMRFKVTDRGSARPEEIFAVLGMSRRDILAQCTITRTEMNLVGSS